MSLLDPIDRAPVAAAPAPDIPAVDLARPDEAAAGLARGCRDWGLFHVVGHGIEAGAVEAASRAFFALPMAEKRAMSRTKANPWGYYDRELTKQRRDRKQIFDIACGGTSDDAPFKGDTPWPSAPAQFQPAMERFAEDCARLADGLLGPLAAGLSMDAEVLRRAFRPSHSSFLRLNYYPMRDPLAAELGESDLGIHHHTDAGALTVLLPDRIPGLQVLRDGLWHEVEPLPGALTVNIGDLVQVWSNDRYPAPVHRVKAMTEADRYTAAFFYNPSYSAVIAPGVPGEARRYRPVPWKAFRAGRAEGDFANYGEEIQITDFRV